MFSTVTVDDRPAPRGRGSAGIWIRAGLILAAAGLFVLTTPDAAVGQTDEGSDEFRATVLDLSERSESVEVALDRSVTVETTVPIARADVIAKHVAEVNVISPTRLLITGQQYGRTGVVLQGTDGTQHVLVVSVELDVSRVNEAMRAIDPHSTAEARSVLGNLVLSGTVSSAERAKRIVELATLFLPPPSTGRKETAVQNHLEVAGEQQVLLRCVVAEVNRSASRELGINGYLIGENFRDAFLVNQLGGINPINVGAAGSSLITQNVPFFTNEDGLVTGGAPSLSLGFPRVQMQLFLRAMADNSLMKILAEPNLVAISGETATFLAGGEFPIPVPQGNQQVTIEFKEFGVRLNFTPLVIGQQRVRLRVAPEVSELDFSVAVQIEGFVVPGLTSRATETTVELGNGETIAIAGLLNERIRGLASRVPGFGDLPVLGALFRSVSFQRSLSELVILVTPEIVAPLDAHQEIALPGEDLVHPGDFELYALGLLEGRDDTADAALGSGALGSGSEAPLASEPEEMSVHGPWGHAGPTEKR